MFRQPGQARGWKVLSYNGAGHKDAFTQCLLPCPAEVGAGWQAATAGAAAAWHIADLDWGTNIPEDTFGSATSDTNEADFMVLWGDLTALQLRYPDDSIDATVKMITVPETWAGTGIIGGTEIWGILNSGDDVWGADCAPNCPGEWDYKDLVTHEFGHAYGLADYPVSGYTMYGFHPKNDQYAKRPQQCELVGLRDCIYHDNCGPAAVRNFVVARGEGDTTHVEWDSVDESECGGFDVLRCDDDGTVWTLAAQMPCRGGGTHYCASDPVAGFSSSVYRLFGHYSGGSAALGAVVLGERRREY